MVTIQTVGSDDWGDIAEFTIEGADEAREGVTYRFTPRPEGPRALVVVADALAESKGFYSTGKNVSGFEADGMRCF